VDNWLARAWAPVFRGNLKIVVEPDPSQPLRINCGKNLADYGHGEWGYPAWISRMGRECMAPRSDQDGRCDMGVGDLGQQRRKNHG